VITSRDMEEIVRQLVLCHMIDIRKVSQDRSGKLLQHVQQC